MVVLLLLFFQHLRTHGKRKDPSKNSFTIQPSVLSVRWYCWYCLSFCSTDWPMFKRTSCSSNLPDSLIPDWFVPVILPVWVCQLWCQQFVAMTIDHPIMLESPKVTQSFSFSGQFGGKVWSNEFILKSSVAVKLEERFRLELCRVSPLLSGGCSVKNRILQNSDSQEYICPMPIQI